MVLSCLGTSSCWHTLNQPLFVFISGGIFTLPSFLSPATKSLLSAMLVVDPLKRITIPEIRQREWFNIGLPEYLNPINNLNIPDPLTKLDDTIVAEIAKVCVSQ
jgi:serine/threonine protein kinase